MYLWSVGIQCLIVEMFAPEVSPNTIKDWFSFCRDICTKHLEENPVMFDNTNVKVELQIDKSLF